MKYIAFYDSEDFKSENRYVNAAAREVVEYMFDVFSTIDNIEIISPSRTLNTKGVYKGRRVKLSDKVTLRLPFTFGTRTKIGRYASMLWIQMWLFFVLLFGTQRGERVVFYHSLSIMGTISLLAKIKGIEPILEFREIYSDIDDVSKKVRKIEHSFYKCAYAFIFPSEAIKNSMDIGNTPYVLAPGSYFTHGYAKDNFGDRKVHAVYGGNLRRDKGGAYLAIDAAQYLPDNYVVHLLSGGYSDAEFDAIDKEIKAVNQVSRAKVVFEGSKFGDEYYRFLSKCDIGLATQKNGDFSNTSFPSKILTYLGCGLKVVSPPIDAVKLSPASGFVYTYEEFDGKSIAEAVVKAYSSTSIDIIEEVKKLDTELKETVSELIIG